MQEQFLYTGYVYYFFHRQFNIMWKPFKMPKPLGHSSFMNTSIFLCQCFCVKINLFKKEKKKEKKKAIFLPKFRSIFVCNLKKPWVH